jgi:hypothetical protein
VVELTPRWIWCLPGNAGNFQCCRVRNRNMPIHPLKQRRVSCGDAIKILPCRERLVGPQGMIPPAAQQPLSWQRLIGGGSHPAKEVRQGSASIQINTELGLSRSRQVDMSIVKSGHHKGALQVDQPGARLLEPQNRDIVAGCDNLVAAHCNGCDPVRDIG